MKVNSSLTALASVVLFSLTIISYASHAQELRAVSQDKTDVLNFIRKLMVAVERDTFANPDELNAELGVQILGWEIVDRPTAKGRHASQIRINVPVLDTPALVSQRRYGIFQTNLGFVYYFDVFRISSAICISLAEVESLLGKADITYGRPHGQNDWAGTYGYSFVISDGKKLVTFHYVSAFGWACLDRLSVRREPTQNIDSPMSN